MERVISLTMVQGFHDEPIRPNSRTSAAAVSNIKILGADARYENDDDEIYVADPTSFESWRQAFIDRHGHDMSVEQEKKLRAKVDKVIDA